MTNMAAYLAQDELPSDFDVIVEGTGFIQSLLAAALSRAGKKVLHLDKNSFYGDSWASLMYRDLAPWMEGEMERVRVVELQGVVLEDGEKMADLRLLDLPSGTSNVDHFIYRYPVNDANKEPEMGEEQQKQPEEQVEGREQQERQKEGEGGNEEEEKEKEKEKGEVKEPKKEEKDVLMEEKERGITWESLGRNIRQLSVDFAPNVMFSRGPLVDLLVESDVTRYLEFQATKKLLIFCNGAMEQVPCSRADLFSSKSVSMVEKRKMMKFLTFCADFEKQPKEYEDVDELSFEEFLQKKKLTPNLIRFIVHSIASVEPDTPVLQGLKSMQTFLQSLGRYGNTPFLFPLYGPGDITQAFCRFSAVFSGIYCLHRSLQAFISNEENRCTGVVDTSGQVMRCDHLIASPSLLNNVVDSRSFSRTVCLSRGVFLTDRPLHTSEPRGISVISIPPGSLGPQQISRVTGFELDHSTCCCPKNTFLVHLACPSSGGCAQDDLQVFADTLLRTPEGGPDNDDTPRLLWRLFYTQEWVTVDQSRCHDDESPLPANIHLASDPCYGGYGYGPAIEEAKMIFQKICPEEAFLPAPEPPQPVLVENPAQEKEEEDQEGEDGEKQAKGEQLEGLDKEEEEEEGPCEGDLPQPSKDVDSPDSVGGE